MTTTDSPACDCMGPTMTSQQVRAALDAAFPDSPKSFKRGDTVTVDGSATVYTVRAVGQAHRDVFLAVDRYHGGGTWVCVDEVHHAVAP